MKFTMNEHGFEADLKFEVLKISSQEEYGFRPFQLMVSSIAGCSGGVLRKVLEKMRLSFDDITINGEIKRNKGKANRIEGIHLTFIISGNNIASEKVEKALKLARKNCAMVQSVQDSIKITEEFEIKGSHLP